MARAPYISRDDLPPEKRDLYDQIAGPRGHVARPFEAMLGSPEVAARVAAVGEQLRYVSPGLSPEVREIVTLTTARQLRCQYLWTHHVSSATEAGVRDPVLVAIRDGTPAHRMLPKEGIFVQFTRELLGQARIRDTTYGAVEHLLGARGAADLVLTIGYYALMCHAINGLGVELEDGVEPLHPDDPATPGGG
jgi:alkylhydroperoxidase family enzyme